METSSSTNMTTEEVVSQDEFRVCENFESQHPIQENSTPNHPVLSIESFQTDYCMVQPNESEPENIATRSEVITKHLEIKNDFDSAFRVRMETADLAGQTHPDVQAKQKELLIQRNRYRKEEEEMQYRIKVSELKKQRDKRIAQLDAELKKELQLLS